MTLQTEHGHFRSIVPSGASKGDYEAVELRDGDSGAFHGQGVTKAAQNVEQILAPAIIKSGLDTAHDLRKIDERMISLDGTVDKSKLGANAILAISMAASRAGAAAIGKPLYEFLAHESNATTNEFVLPVPFMNVLNGGDHSGNPMAFQEFMIAPIHAISFAQAVQWNAETYASLRSLIIKRYGTEAIGLGDEGGFAPPVSHPRQALDLLVQAIEEAGHTGKIKIGIDPASQSFFKDGKYDLGFKTDKPEVIGSDELGDLYRDLLGEYPIVLLEDPFGQDDWDSFAKFHASSHVELVGDDLLATNKERIEMGIKKKACNSLLLKINQIGTITEALQAYVAFSVVKRRAYADEPTQCEPSLRRWLVSLRLASLR